MSILSLKGPLFHNFVLAKGSWNFWHPVLPLGAEELALRGNFIPLIERSPKDIAELIRSSLPIFAKVCATLRTEFSSHTVVLLKALSLAAGVAKGLQGNLCGKAKVRPKSSLAAGTMTKGRPGFVRGA